MKLKILLVLIIGLFTISPTFADYWPTTWISIKSYWPFMTMYTLDLTSSWTEIYDQDIYINQWGTYYKLDATYCEASYVENNYDWDYHVICNKNSDFFSPVNISNVYFFVEWEEPTNPWLDALNMIGSWALASAWWISSWATWSFLFIWLWGMFLLAIAGLIIIFIRQIKVL